MSSTPEQQGNGVYPPAPWRLAGMVMQTVSLIPLATARAVIPPEVEIVPVWPGYTLGGLLLANYHAPSTLSYHELIVFAGRVRYARKTAFWVSHIYVDDPASMKAGHELWGLPKELATFTWHVGPTQAVEVQQDDRLLASVQCPRPLLGIHFPFSVRALGTVSGKLTSSRGFGHGHGGITRRGHVAIPDDAPFAPLNLATPRCTFNGEIDLNFNVEQVLNRK